MRQTANLKDLSLPMFLPGIKINTGPTNYFPIKQLQMIRFDGTKWLLFGEIDIGELIASYGALDVEDIGRRFDDRFAQRD